MGLTPTCGVIRVHAVTQRRRASTLRAQPTDPSESIAANDAGKLVTYPESLGFENRACNAAVTSATDGCAVCTMKLYVNYIHVRC